MIEPLTQLNTKRFQVALSFAGEHRNFVEGVAEQLSRNLGQNRVFYDRYYEAELARPNLDTHLINIYRDDTDLIAIFLCSNYTQKEWCGLEWRVVRDVLKKRRDWEIMPFKFDDVIIEGLLSSDGYIKINNRTPEEVACLILQRIDGKNTFPLHSSESKLSEACDEIELVLDVDIEAFTPEREQRFLRVLSLLLKDADIRIRRKRPGNSTILTLDLTSQQWNILKKAIERGELAEFKPKELLVNGVSVIAPQAPIRALGTPAARPTVADTVIKAYVSREVGMAQETILLADNNIDFLQTRRVLLEQAGYKVITASNLIEARQLLGSTHIDLAILDIRLEDDKDEKDISGLLLARESAHSVPKIMLTLYPSVDTVRPSLSGLTPGGAVAVDYVTKADGPEALLRVIRTVLQQKIFIAYGHDEDAKNAVALLIKNLGLRDIVFDEQPNAVHAVIDQFENHANVGFAIALLTPDDVGGSKDRPGDVKPRARQNVIFEFGYFIGKLGRQCVCALYKEGVELPSQYPDVLYLPMDRDGMWKDQLARKMRNAGLNIVRDHRG